MANEMDELERLIAEADAERDGNSNENIEEVEPSDDDENLDDENKTKEPSDDETNENKDDENNHQDENKTDEENNKVKEFEPIEFEYSGHKIKVESQDELMAMLRKSAELQTNFKPKTKEELALEQAGLSAEDIALYIDAKNGDKNALAKIATLGKIDLLDVSEEDATAYIKKFDIVEPNDAEIVAQSIVNDKQLFETFTRVTSGLPKHFIQAVTSNGKDLATFKEQIQSGLAQEIIPQALKLTYQGVDFIDAYVRVGTKIMSERASNNTQQQQQPQDRTISDREKNLRKIANDKNSGSQKTNKNVEADDVWNMSDADFEKLVSSGKID